MEKRRVFVPISEDVESYIRKLRNKEEYAFMPVSKILLKLCENGIKYIDEQDSKGGD